MRSATRSRFRSSRSAASTPRTPPTAFAPARRESPSSLRSRRCASCARRSMQLSEAGELGLLAELERRGLVTCIEDDAAQLADGVVVTQDALVENVHFRLDRISWREVGFRAAAVNLSDLAASGAEPEALIVTLGAPPETIVEDVVELYEGLAEAAVPVRGGDTTVAGRVVLSVTAIGRTHRIPGRGGAGPGDRLGVTGPLGAAGAAFRD